MNFGQQIYLQKYITCPYYSVYFSNHLVVSTFYKLKFELRTVSEKKVKKAMMGMKKKKSSGPDGISQENITHCILYYHETVHKYIETLLCQNMATFVVLRHPVTILVTESTEFRVNLLKVNNEARSIKILTENFENCWWLPPWADNNSKILFVTLKVRPSIGHAQNCEIKNLSSNQYDNV